MSSIIRSTDETLDGTIATFSGLKFRPLDPDPELIVVDDLAHHLSNMCRFAGAVREFYSVAQHSVLTADLLYERFNDVELARWGLLHDGSEAYLSDMVRPVKKDPRFGTFYLAAEEVLMRAVAERFGLTWPMPEEVSWADNVLLRTEQRDLMPPIFRHAGEDYYEGTYTKTLVGWEPNSAEYEFLYWIDKLAVAH